MEQSAAPTCPRCKENGDVVQADAGLFSQILYWYCKTCKQEVGGKNEETENNIFKGIDTSFYINGQKIEGPSLDYGIDLDIQIDDNGVKASGSCPPTNGPSKRWYYGPNGEEYTIKNMGCGVFGNQTMEVENLSNRPLYVGSIKIEPYHGAITSKDAIIKYNPSFDPPKKTNNPPVYHYAVEPGSTSNLVKVKNQGSQDIYIGQHVKIEPGEEQEVTQEFLNDNPPAFYPPIKN